ncbi:protein FAM227B-like [Dysidea avara]|uniref:protein FAM227B-like n=1 Tax=Dysidea avara TaxID=196820 RepID=UPI00332F7498
MIQQFSSVISEIPSFMSEKRSSSVAPPETKDEWLRRESIPEWPKSLVEHEEASVENVASVLDSVENVERDLKNHAKYDSNFLDTVSKKLAELETNMTYLSDFFLSNTPRHIKLSTSGGLSNLPRNTFLEQLFDVKTLEGLHSSKDNKQQVVEEKIAENAVFPGISPEMLTIPLPFQLEALQILDLVTKQQKFPKSLVKSWKKSYYSEASIAVFQNTFWWIWMEKYKPDVKLQAKIFDQVAESFLVLITNISQKHKDEYFKWYPSCLAQAVYSAFCHSFPESHKSFTDGFKQYIASITLEWTMGIRSLPSCWMQWPLEALDPYLHAGSEQDDKTLPKSASAEKDILQTLKQEMSPHKSAVVHFKSAAKRDGTAVGRQPKTPEGQHQESHSIGPGATYERVNFSISGRSPLVQHYMSIHHLCESNGGWTGPALTRTEVKALPPPAPTYKQVAIRFQNEAEQRYEEYERNMLKSDLEIKVAQQKHRKLQSQMERLNREILFKKHEVKLLCEKLLTNKQDFTARRIRATLSHKTTK